MLPILRIISVGGVFLAIVILGLALMPPGRPHAQFAMDDSAARGALIDRRAHPEWRQFLIHSALKRADEIGRLRDLPEDAPAAASEPHNKVAGLPAARTETVPEDVTGTVNVAPAATIPIDIGATSSFELPVTPIDEKPPISRTPSVSLVPADNASEAVAVVTVEPSLSKLPALSPPEQAKPVVVIRKRHVRKPAARSPAPATPGEVAMPPPFNIFQAFFVSLNANQNAAGAQATKPGTKPATRRARTTSNKTAEIR